MSASISFPFNPNPISKCVVLLLLGGTVIHPLHPYFVLAIVCSFAFFYLINQKPMTAIKSILLYLLFWVLPELGDLQQVSPILMMFLSFAIVLKLFYLPFLAGHFFIQTSDVGHIISSMDALKIPMSFSIPIAVMFRFFPSFREERQHIETAMKVRGITTKNPIQYIQYIAIPMLILSSTITDDIAKAAETRCIANPGKKTRYYPVRFGWIDIFFLLLMGLLLIGGWLWYN